MNNRFRVVFIDDKRVNYEVMEAILRRSGCEIFWESNGHDGIKKIEEICPEIILLDIDLPDMGGFEICQVIKNKPTISEIPIIFMSGYVEEEFIEKGFLVGGADYISKPFKRREVVARINNQIEKFLLKKRIQEAFDELEQKNKIELDVLRYRQTYHLLQQENGFKKQIKITQDELSAKEIDGMFFETYYKPLDIVSGDMYGTVYLSSHTYLCYIIDAMGKGLSASVSSIQSLSIIKKLIEEQRHTPLFDLKRLVDDYISFIQHELLRDEIMCVLFMIIDTQQETMQIASFGMPPVIVACCDDVKVVRNNNLPLSNINDIAHIDTLGIHGFRKILLYSDGFDEVLCLGGEPYSQYLMTDLQQALFLNELISLRQKRLNDTFDDDITVIFIHRLELPLQESYALSFPSTIKDAGRVNTILDKLPWVSEYIREHIELDTVLTELGMNALEHGNFGVKKKFKQYAIAHNIYYDVLQEMSESDLSQKHIEVKAIVYEKNEQKILELRIKDQGDGFCVEEAVKEILFNLDKSPVLYHGRGIKIVKNMVDALFFNHYGNEVILFKIFDRRVDET